MLWTGGAAAHYGLGMEQLEARWRWTSWGTWPPAALGSPRRPSFWSNRLSLLPEGVVMNQAKVSCEAYGFCAPVARLEHLRHAGPGHHPSLLPHDTKYLSTYSIALGHRPAEAGGLPQRQALHVSEPGGPLAQ